ncbi:MAG: DUF493 domain-containing protein [Planctomycetota bacterium]
MDYLPTLELLESVHRFPGSFTFKVIGKVDGGFAARVVAAVRETLALEQDPPFRLRETANGRHVAVTVEPIVQTSREVLLVYERVKTISGVVMFF